METEARHHGRAGTDGPVVKLPLKPFCMVGATTRAGLLTSALRDRFGDLSSRLLRPRGPAEDLRRSATIRARGSRTGAAGIAGRARHAAHRESSRRVRGFAECAPKQHRRTVARDALRLLDVDEAGFDKMDRAPADVIDKFAGGPVGPTRCRRRWNEERDTIEDVFEPFHPGFLERTPRGRVTCARLLLRTARGRARTRTAEAVVRHARHRKVPGRGRRADRASRRCAPSRGPDPVARAPAGPARRSRRRGDARRGVGAGPAPPAAAGAGLRRARPRRVGVAGRGARGRRAGGSGAVGAHRTSRRGALPRRAAALPRPRGAAGGVLRRLPGGLGGRAGRRLARAAAAAWQEAGDPYEAALELAESGDPEATAEALRMLEDLRAEPAAALVRERLRAMGARIPPARGRSRAQTRPA